MRSRAARIEEARLTVRMAAVEARIAEAKQRRSQGEVVITITGEIGTDVRGEDVVNQIRAARGQPLRLIIDSPGGSTKDGLAIIAALERHDALIQTEARLAASMAAIIYCCGRQRSIASGGRLFFHVGHIRAGAELRADKLRDMAKHLDGFRRRCEQIVFTATKAPMARVRNWFRGDGEAFTPEQAVAAGLAHRIAAPEPRKPSARQPRRLSAADVARRTLVASPEFQQAAASARAAARKKPAGTNR
ncbi:MAG: ATP-dependent Clp protease proteolytic subunit [Kiloniellaceae bacterium]